MSKVTKYVENFLRQNECPPDLLDKWVSKDNARHVKKLTKDRGSDTRDAKSPNAPKRALSAYIYFCNDMRDQVRDQLGPGASAKDVMAFLGNMWQHMHASDTEDNRRLIEKYEHLAQSDKDRYNAEKSSYVPSRSRQSDNVVSHARADEVAAVAQRPTKRGSARGASYADQQSQQSCQRSYQQPSAEYEYPQHQSPKNVSFSQNAYSIEKTPSQSNQSYQQTSSVAAAGTPQRAQSAYLVFSNLNRDAVRRALGPEATAPEVTKELAYMWNELKNDPTRTEEYDYYVLRATNQTAR